VKGEKVMSNKFKSGFVSLVGRTNVGKSSIINALVGEKVAAIANKPQTTRTAIRGIVNKENLQIVFVDTPGIHKPKTKLGNVMVETALGMINDVDILLYVVESTSSEIGRGDRMILEKIKNQNIKTILIINKIDLIKKDELAKLINLYSKEYNFESIIPVSVIKNINVQEILKEIEKNLKEGPAYYDIEEDTDQTMRQLVEETIREKALKFLNEEVPHGLYIEAQKMKKRKTMEKQPIYDIDVTIYCLKNSHKGIIIGKEGVMLKRIGTYARQDLEKLLQTKINLKIWVKVKEDWLNNDNMVKKFKMDT